MTMHLKSEQSLYPRCDSNDRSAMTRVFEEVTCRACIRMTLDVLESGGDPDVDFAACHCGLPANDCGNGIENICDACLADWEAAGEPEECPRCVAA